MSSNTTQMSIVCISEMKNSKRVAVEEEIIGMVKLNPFLYERKHEMYKNKCMRNKKFNELGKKLNVPAQQLKARWRTLKDKFFQEFKAELIPSGSADEAVKSKWKWMERLRFLENIYTPVDNSPCSSLNISKTVQELQQNMTSLVDRAKIIAEPSVPKSAAQLFFESLAKQTEEAELTPAEFCNLQIEILKALKAASIPNYLQMFCLQQI
ncbi:transcription factor Adf-1-like [Teleopsis dalmanni]|uniref:transcription factor Adf-1-like n=1 Tax=Teleopsis dalmanni TaxID=139649 RepID=UPI000D32AB11|nr:transcription factor Adf-1-like [Teleopsis dalmanni]